MQPFLEWDRETFRLIHLSWTAGWLGPAMALISMSGVGHCHVAPLLVAWAKEARWKALPVLLALLFVPVVYVIGSADEAGGMQALAYVLLLAPFGLVPPKVAKQAILVFVLSGLIHIAIKAVMPSDRPSNLEWAIPMENVYATRSFPSGHTSTAVAVGLMLFLLLPNRWLGGLALVWGLLVGYSRIYVGVHWPSDVVGGIAVALVSVAITRWIGLVWESRQEPQEPLSKADGTS